MNPPAGISNLLIGCCGESERQFSGIRRLLALLGKLPGTFLLPWGSGRLDLHRRRRLVRVLVAGHGREGSPGFQGPDPLSAEPLTPECLHLPPRTWLFLMGCYQGADEFKRKWAEGTGASPDRIQGSAGETESALSTCLLLHLLEQGIESLERWFPEWIRCNAALEPFFSSLRESYRVNCGDPLATWEAIRTLPAVQPFQDFLSIGTRRPEFLTGLA